MERDAAAGSGVLGDDERPVGARLGDRVADVGQVGDRTPVVQAVPPGALRTTLEDVPGDDPGGELVPVLGAPAELVRSGAMVSAVSVDRPVTTTFAPRASASTIGVEPM
jgi:hypothetical protein